VRRVQLVFHRGENWVEVRRRSALGQSTVRHRLDEIAEAVVQSSRSSEGGTTYRAALVIPQGESQGVHPVTIYYSSGRGAARMARAINDWLNAARAADATDDIGQTTPPLDSARPRA